MMLSGSGGRGSGLYLLPAAENGEEDDEGNQGIEEAAHEGDDAYDCTGKEPDGAGEYKSGSAPGLISPGGRSLQGLESGQQLDVADDYQHEPGDTSYDGDEVSHDGDNQENVGDIDVLGRLTVCVCRLYVYEFLDIQEEQYVSSDDEYLADGVQCAECTSWCILPGKGCQNADRIEDAVNGSEDGSEDACDGVDPDGLDDHACVLGPWPGISFSGVHDDVFSGC